MEAYSYTKEGVEELLDVAKIVILKDLVNSGLLDIRSAERYAGKTMMIINKKTIFRTISNLWNKEKESDGFYVIAVHSDVIDALENQESTTKDKNNKVLKLIPNDKDSSNVKDKE